MARMKERETDPKGKFTDQETHWHAHREIFAQYLLYLMERRLNGFPIPSISSLNFLRALGKSGHDEEMARYRCPQPNRSEIGQ
jgi:hypothetical protein